ncbi:MAG: hypothetical protein KGZ25_12690, partial [Planctomycetes bacterium]|nr:hypothetical protein [Planctomycetota bacterium]
VMGTYHRISLLRISLRILRGLSEGLEAIFTPLKSTVRRRYLLRAPCALLVLLHRDEFNAPPTEPACLMAESIGTFYRLTGGF